MKAKKSPFDYGEAKATCLNPDCNVQFYLDLKLHKERVSSTPPCKGLCPSCYRTAKMAVEGGVITWDTLEAHGMCYNNHAWKRRMLGIQTSTNNAMTAAIGKISAEAGGENAHCPPTREP